MSVNLGPPTRDALIGDSEIADGLSLWNNEPAIFTRRPTPADAEYPMVLINSPAAFGDEDALNSDRPVIVFDVAFYGRKAEPGSEQDQTRLIEAMGRRARTLFHRNKWAIQPEGFSVIDLTASGPLGGPVDDEVTVARIVTLRIRLRRN